MSLWAWIFPSYVNTMCVLKWAQREEKTRNPRLVRRQTNCFCNRYLILSWQNFAFLALAPSSLWLHGLEIRQLGLPKIQGDVCLSLFPVCAVFQVLIPLLFVLVPSHCLQGTSFPYPCSHGNNSLFQQQRLCLFISSLSSYVLQLRSSLIFCLYFISFVYQAMCPCSKTSAVNILILYVALL